MPFSVPLMEVGALDMSCYASEGDRGLSPPLKVIVEFVVFDPLDTADIFLMNALESYSLRIFAYSLICLPLELGLPNGSPLLLLSRAFLPRTES